MALARDDSKIGKTSMYVRSDAMDDFIGSFLPFLSLLCNSLRIDRFCVVDEGGVVALARDDSIYVPTLMSDAVDDFKGSFLPSLFFFWAFLAFSSARRRRSSVFVGPKVGTASLGAEKHRPISFRFSRGGTRWRMRKFESHCTISEK